MRVVRGREMQRLDRRAIEGYRIPGLLLMEHAGQCVAQEIQRRYRVGPETRVAVVAGKGNNGGDGFVVARALYRKGVPVEVFLLASPREVGGDARVNLEILQRLGVPVQRVTGSSLPRIRRRLNQAHVRVDAIFGTGLSTPVRGLHALVVEAMNRSPGRPTVAVDMPTGIHADTGEVLGCAVRAAVTVTMGLPKLGLFLPPGMEYAGTVTVADIGFPKELVHGPGRIQLLEAKPLASWIPPRPLNSHKGTYGRVLVVGGSAGKTGAAALASEAALRVGAGLVTLALPKSLNPAMETKLTEVMTLPLPETPEQSLALDAEEPLLKAAQQADLVALGPGLSTHPETVALVRRLMGRLRQAVVLDADGLNALAGSVRVLAQGPGPTVVTPHPGEMGRLAGMSAARVQQDRLGVASAFARRHKVWVVLKGARTLVADPDGSVAINVTGNPGMATGGTGDVLTGVLAGLMAQGIPAGRATRLGVYLHGLAGDLAAESLGEEGALAGDLLSALPAALRRLREGNAPPPVEQVGWG